MEFRISIHFGEVNELLIDRPEPLKIADIGCGTGGILHPACPAHGGGLPLPGWCLPLMWGQASIMTTAPNHGLSPMTPGLCLQRSVHRLVFVKYNDSPR